MYSNIFGDFKEAYSTETGMKGYVLDEHTFKKYFTILKENEKSALVYLRHANKTSKLSKSESFDHTAKKKKNRKANKKNRDNF